MLRLVQRCLPRALFAVFLFGAGAAMAGSPVEDADFLDALTWGISPSSYQELRTLGREQWLKAQLAPPAEPRLPSNLKARIAALDPTDSANARLVDVEARLREARNANDANKTTEMRREVRVDVTKLKNAAIEKAVIRAASSRDQVRERLAWFWFNHFNVRAKNNTTPVIGDYVEHAIRPHVLGRFRDLLAATVKHPAMLHYLDNAQNRVNRRNENYAREIMELHTMGADSGYSQGDVENLARILSGVSTIWYDRKKGSEADQEGRTVLESGFVFNAKFHDFGDKTLLGRTIRGRGWEEVDEAIDIISAHPATARRVSRQLATYFMGGVEPSDGLVKELAAVFTRSDGRIAAVLDALFHSREFEASLGKQFKDPMRFVFSAIRLAHDGREIGNTGLVHRWLRKLGQGFFERSTPDGYPLEPSAWNSPGQLLARFEVAKEIGSGRPSLFVMRSAAAIDDLGGDVGGQLGGRAGTPHLKSDLYTSVLAGTMSEKSRAALSKAKSDEEWNTLFLSSPEFMK